MRSPQATLNPYATLQVSPTATQAQIKQAYRRLVKQFHPDAGGEQASNDRMVEIVAAYEIVGDRDRRRAYDAGLDAAGFNQAASRRAASRQQRDRTAQTRYRQRTTGQDADTHLQRWLQGVYHPIDRILRTIIGSLGPEINALAADPFDDDLLMVFDTYLKTCRSDLEQAHTHLRSMPNPRSVAGVAAHLYYCLDRVGDGLDELAYFPLNYDDSRLHAGQEMFRIARGLRREAAEAVRNLPR
jgi:molecular chaperone DnaJ